MSIKGYKRFLEEKEDANYRDDEHSYLNDGLTGNNSRWDDSTYDPYEEEDDDSYHNDPGYRKLHDDDDEYKGEFEEDDINQDDMDHLIYLLRTMFRNSGVENVRIDNDKGLDISIYCTLERKERLKDIVKIFEVVNKLKRDILSQYDSEFDTWTNIKGQPMFVFSFEYNEGLGDDSDVF